MFGDVGANHGKIAIVQLPNVGTAIRGVAARSVAVFDWANSSDEHEQYVNIWKYVVNFFCSYKHSVGIEGESRAVCAQLVRLLKEERERRGISKYAIAAKTGLAQQTVGYAERGLTSPSFDTIYRMARALEIDLGELVRRAEARAKVKRG